MSTASSGRGGERIDELQAKYLSVPRSVLVKLDCLNNGVRRTEALKKIGAWAIPDSYSLFQWDMSVDPDRPQEIGHGAWALTPWDFYLKDGTHTMLNINDSSPYEIRPLPYPQAGRYHLYRDGDPIEEVFFAPRPGWYTKRASDGTLLGNIMFSNGAECMVASTLKYCEYYFKHEEGCRYCSIGSAQEAIKALGIERKVTVKPEHFYEAYSEAIREQNIRHILMIGGSFLDTTKETEYYVRLIRAFNRAIEESGAATTIGINPNALTPDECGRIVDACGPVAAAFNLEIWDRRIFEHICPGKAKHIGYEEWRRRSEEAAKIFGFGELACNFIVGVEMLEPFGFRSYAEGLASVVEGFRWNLDHGIVPMYCPHYPAVGSALQDAPHSPTEYYIDINEALWDLKRQYGMVLRGGKVPYSHPKHVFWCHNCEIGSCEQDNERLLNRDYAA